VPFPGIAYYAATKAAVVAYTKGWARDLGPMGITVNTVQPGPIDTDMNPDNSDFAAVLKASMALGRYGRPLEGITEEYFYKQFNVNLLGPIFATPRAVQHFGSDGESIINISSAASIGPQPDGSVYSTSMGALENITRASANELGPRKIRVNAMSPGLVDMEGVRAAGVMDSPELKYYTSLSPFGRVGQPSDIATVAVFLASSDSAWITGETLRVQGGVR
jgi:NAD(P)-dependent dehydrogenase (short-subunit alcohol dehydrogenase family)